MAAALEANVIMPDHVHFSCAPQSTSKNSSHFVGSWKEWTRKRMVREIGFRGPVWRPEFFHHLLRSGESYHSRGNMFSRTLFVPDWLGAKINGDSVAGSTRCSCSRGR
jgi:REP element-mobilizing transposase RayT